MTRKEIKALAIEQAQKDLGNKEAKKQTLATYKERIKNSEDKLERKQLKKERKYYKKQMNKKVRYTSWTIVAVVFAIVVVKVGPLVSNIMHAMGASDITMDSSTPEGQAAMAHGDAVSYEIAQEGIVLMKNEDQSLPLNDEKINVFGVSPHEMKFGGAGSGNSDQSRKVGFFDSLDEKGIEYNKELSEFYKESWLRMVIILFR